MTDGWTVISGEDARSLIVGGPETVAGPERFAEVVREAVDNAWRARRMVELVSPEGAELTVGFGHSENVATFKASADAPHLVSRGTGDASETFVFFWGSDEREFSGDQTIPADVGLHAIAQFYETGQRPTCIEWREV